MSFDLDQWRAETRRHVETTLRKTRFEQLAHGHDWDVADVLPPVLTLLAEAWADGHENCVSPVCECPNPYKEEP